MSKKIISFDSQLLTALSLCPRLAKLSKIDSLVPNGPKSNALEAGSLVHIILEYYHKALIAGRSRKDAIDTGYYAGREFISGASEHNVYLVNPDTEFASNLPDESDKYLIGWKYVFQTMDEYFIHYANDSYTPIDAECVRGEIIYEDDDIVILWKAKFDLIGDFSGGILPMDHKTMKQRRDTGTNNYQFIGQDRLLGVRSIIINKIGFQTTLKPEEKFIRSTISYSPDRIAEFCNDIVPYYAKMLISYDEMGVYPPSFTSCETKYGFCDFYKDGFGSICTSDRNMRDTAINLFFHKGKVWDINNE